jgi:hypothetical protein
MLTLTFGDEVYNEDTNEFLLVNTIRVDLEHSLLSVSKWESKYEKPFLAPGEKTSEELLGYIEAMFLTPNIPEGLLNRFSQSHMDLVNTYINSNQSATTFGFMPESKGKKETITSELIYYWMIALNIPFEAESWNLNRLFALIKICNVKSNGSKPSKMTKQQLAARNAQINAERRSKLQTSG